MRLGDLGAQLVLADKMISAWIDKSLWSVD